MKSFLLVVVVILANIHTPALSADKIEQPEGISFWDFSQKILETGLDTYIPGIIGDLIEFPKDCPAKLIEVSKTEAIDKMDHVFQVALEISKNKKPPAIIGLTLQTHYKWPGNNESYWFRTDNSGALLKVIVIHGKRDDQGKPIRGAGTVTEKDIHSPEIVGRFQHELDFWLKGAYRKATFAGKGSTKVSP